MKVIIDSREQKPWSFSFFGAEEIHKKLDTGDYTVYGYEKQFTIDRKASLSELYSNLFKDYSRFKKEILRCEGMEAYILCEFPYNSIARFPHDSGIPNKYSKTRGWTWDNLRWGSDDIMDKIQLLSERDNINFLFCMNRGAAEQKAYQLMKDFYERQIKKPK
jgi:hypothetical protein